MCRSAQPILSIFGKNSPPHQSFPLCKQFKKQNNKSLLTFSKSVQFQPGPKVTGEVWRGQEATGASCSTSNTAEICPHKLRNTSVSRLGTRCPAKSTSPLVGLEQVAVTSAVCSPTRPLWLALLTWVNKNKSACLFETHTHTPTHAPKTLLLQTIKN